MQMKVVTDSISARRQRETQKKAVRKEMIHFVGFHKMSADAPARTSALWVPLPFSRTASVKWENQHPLGSGGAQDVLLLTERS